MSISYEELVRLRKSMALEKSKPSEAAAPRRTSQQQSNSTTDVKKATNPLHRKEADVTKSQPTSASDDLAPRVMTSSTAIRGELPRAQQEQRKRRRFEQAPPIQMMLEKLGVPETAGSNAGNGTITRTKEVEYHTLLPLAAFDDSSADDLTLDDWATRVNTAGCGLPCSCAVADVRGGFSWVKGSATAVHVATGQIEVVLESSQKKSAPGESTVTLPRIQVCFVLESAEKFAKRFAEAYHRRRTAERVLRTDLYTKSIPTDEYQTLDPVVLARIRDTALSTPMLLESEGNLNVQVVMEEARGGYNAVMNADLLERHTKQESHHSGTGGAVQTPIGKASGVIAPLYQAAAAPTPLYGILPSSTVNFASIVSAFRHECYWGQHAEISSLLRRIASTSEALSKRGIYITAGGLANQRPFSLSAFDDLQSAAVRDSLAFARDTWISSVSAIVKSALAPKTSEDPLHLYFYDVAGYNGSTTEAFLRRLQRQMQDSLRGYILSSVEVFVRFLENAGSFEVTVRSMNEVIVAENHFPAPRGEFGEDGRHTAALLSTPPFVLRPLLRFALQLHEKAPTEPSKESNGAGDAASAATEGAEAPAGAPADNGSERGEEDAEDAADGNSRGSVLAPTIVLQYNCTMERIRGTFMSLLQRGFTQHGTLRTVERSLFEFLYDPATAYFDVPSLSDPFAASCMERVERVLERANTAMEAYLATYAPYEHIVSLRPDVYVAEFKEKFPTTRGVEQEVQRLMDVREDILRTVPDEVSMGFVVVDCTDLRRQLMTKCSQAASQALDVMASRALAKEEEVNASFTEIYQSLRRPAETPEAVVALKDFIKTIPELVFDLQEAITEVQGIHDLLDGFQRPLTEEEFNKKWKMIGWPAELDDAVNERVQELEETKRCLLAAMGRSQEVFEKEVESMQQVVEQYAQHKNYNRLDQIAEDVRQVQERIQLLRNQASTFNTHEGLFNFEKTDYTAVQELAAAFEPYIALWTTSKEWTDALADWHRVPFDELNADAVEQRVTDSLRVMNQCTRDPRLTADLVQCAERTLSSIQQFRPLVPVIKYLRTEGMKPRHWEQLSKELGFSVVPQQTLNLLDDVKRLNLLQHAGVLQRIAEIASREYQIESSLARMKEDWAELRLKVQPYKATGCFVVAKDVVDEMQEKLDDQTLITQSLSFSPFKKMFEQEIEEWEASLRLVQSVLDEWLMCQKSWLYLEPIFQSEDIARQLPSEFKRFNQVNKNWKHLTGEAHRIDRAMEFCKVTEKCLELLKENNNLLELVERGLNQYLENKRASFARFYFLSDDELLSILSTARDPQSIQPQFRKLFENIAKIDMRAPDNEMFGMYSHMGEYVPFAQSVLPRKYVENWLTEVEQMMKISMRQQLDVWMKQVGSMDKTDFLLRAPGQVAIAVNQILWTAECEESLRTYGSLQPYVEKAQENLMVLVQAVRKPLSSVQRMNLSGLITIEVHARDIVDELAKSKVDNIYAFEWVSQLRSYWENNDCYLRQVEAQFKYGGEYLGNTTRLVITPLTDRIYLTLTGAMHMFLGGAPAGPAGTGKTETVKDLAKAVAKQCVVFNCQEGMTYASMGKFFKGLAQAGAWACFDEFNRIDVEVLSVVAQQVSSLQEAARTKQYRIPFEGTEILVDPTYSVFITMNPGYAGRTELPDNLKVLFRPVACMVPDYAMIAEIRLFSFGYTDSRKLAQKMVATFRLSSEQLSSQDHYDFGMRAVNTVISAAGLMKREHPDEAEELLLLRALRDSNTPKFLEEDLLLFDGIISDLFPGVEMKPSDSDILLNELRKQATELHLQPTEMFIKKCVQLHEMSILRHGQMSVGPTMGGKTSAMRVLQTALTSLHDSGHEGKFSAVKTHCLNPKSITMAQLYGGFDDVTGEWRDGLIGELFRIAARDTSDCRQWIVFDGPVDALWIESMNTVLDENKKLCLISGEIIAMTPQMNCWFEVEDLAVASPATVSRAGMIYLDPERAIGVSNFVRSWQMHRLPPTMDPYKEQLQELCEQLFPSLIQFLQTQAVEYCPSVWPNLISSCFNIFSCFLGPYTPTRTYEVPQDKLDLLREIHLHLLIFAIVWSFGATSDKASRTRFDKFLRDELRLRNVNIELPVIGCLQDYEFIPEERRWVSWTDRLPTFSTQVTQANFGDLIVPTPDVARFKYVVRLLVQNAHHTLSCGPTGTGKTVLMQQLLMNEMPKEFTPIFFTFSARTSANQTQDLIFSKFEVRRRASPQIWGAPLNKKFAIFIDDMNMPMKEQYGAQPPIEILRQYMDYHGWYDRRTREFFQIVDVVYAAAMGPPGGGRNHVSQRFLRHFNQIAVPEVDDDSMRRIFATLMENYFAPFGEEIRTKIGAVVAASIDVFNTVSRELKPTPSRPHYLFNLRDLAKVMNGLVNANSSTVKNVPSLMRLWLHEELRTFGDRLTCDEDRTWFTELLKKSLQKHVKIGVDDVMSGRQDGDVSKEKGSSMNDLLFVDFAGEKSAARTYKEVPNFDSLRDTLDKQLQEYSQQSTDGRHKLDLVMFADAVKHVCRVARVIRNASGHVLLLGVGGSGRQSISRLAAYLNEYDVFQVEISKGYTMNAWREDIKGVLRRVALQGKHVLFLFSDTQIVHESMLEDVNNILNSGEVPNLFVAQEFEDLLTSMRPTCIAEGIPLDKVSIYSRFVRGCRKMLHVALCMSPLGEVFRGRLRMFPALVNCCTIDWFAAWPEQALHSVSRNYFESFELLPTEEDKERCAQFCVKAHASVEAISQRFHSETGRYNYVTPTSFLEFLRTFQSLLEFQTSENAVTRNRFVNGLEKLRETEDAVAGLQQTLADSQPVLLEKNKAIKALVEEMAVETADAEQTKKEAEVEQEAVASMQAECASIEQEAQGQLAEALPELDRALESLKNLKSSQISEVAGYKAPTAGVVMTMQGICILFQIKPTMRAANAMEEKKADYWVTAKEQLLNNPNLLMQRLIQFDKENIPERLIQAVQPLVSSEDFTPKKIAGASQACAAMCQWTHAMVRFHEVNKKVEPLRQKLAVAQGANNDAQRKLKEAQDKLEVVARRLAEMQRRKEEAEAEMEELDRTVKNTALKLERAAMLIDGLAGEKRSWTGSVEKLDENAKFLLGNMLVAAAQIAYCGAFTSTYRSELLQLWKTELVARQLLSVADVSVYHTLQDAVETRAWSIQGLPTDQLSVENALILSRARRWPLLIDPQTQGNKWIRNMYKDVLEVLKPSQKDLIKRIEFCIRAGRPVLLENVGEDIDASLNPLLERQTFMQGGTEMIRISDSAIPWNPKFRFFMTTKNPNPHYIPEVMVRVTLLNFFITPQGLEDQLLGVVVGQERKDLETRRSDLIQRNAAMKADLVETQRTILRKMEEVEGDILDDVELIEYLNVSKEKTSEIVLKVSEAEAAEVELTASREEYRPIARHSSCLYFCCATLSNVDPMYQYSLQWFVRLFVGGIEKAPAAEEVEKRLENLKEYFTYSFYQNVTRSLFEKHKIMFSFYLCVRLMQEDDKVDSEEFRFLLQGPTVVEKADHNPDSSWLTDASWSDLRYLEKHFGAAFGGFTTHFAENLDHYRELFLSSAAHHYPMAGAFEKALTPMQHLMFLRCLRPDKVMEAVQDFVSADMGPQFIRPPSFDLLTSFRDSTALTPLIFVLSQGADPYEDWKKFAETQHMSKKLYDISLGQGQGPRAERMMQEAMESGAWVLLQNCHLATSWMPTLERLVEGMTSATHPSFRLWLTSMPDSHFPVAVLQNGVKMTNEPPKGMQANVTRSLLSYTNDFLETCKKPVAMKKLFFSMCFFHALIQERRKFGPLGWNIAYEYTSGDLACCVSQIKMFLDKYDEVPYTVIRELSGNIHYGGRVTDDWDRRTLNTLLQRFVGPAIMEDDYCFSSLTEYSSIPPSDRQGYLDYVASWPINTNPEVFGLHENADIACARSETFETLASMVLLQAKSVATSSSGSGAKVHPDDVVTELAKSIDARIAAPFDVEKFRRKYPTKYEDSMNTVLVQEAIRFNRVVQVVHQTLEQLPLAIRGEVVMNKELEEVYQSLYNNQVPSMWADKAYPSLKSLAGWVDDFVLRLAMIQRWYEQGHPTTYWISGFFFPQAFLTGILQNYARTEQISIDTISYSFEWMSVDAETITEPPASGCYIHGMFIEGARIDPNTLLLTESLPKVLFESTPMLWLRPMKDRQKPNEGIYDCPLYKTVRRAGTLSTTGHSTNYVLTAEIPLPADKGADHWVRRGVAMICALST